MDSKIKRRHHAALCRSVRQSGDTRREASLTCSDYCVANGAPLLLLAALMLLVAPVYASDFATDFDTCAAFDPVASVRCVYGGALGWNQTLDFVGSTSASIKETYAASSNLVPVTSNGTNYYQGIYVYWLGNNEHGNSWSGVKPQETVQVITPAFMNGYSWVAIHLQMNDGFRKGVVMFNLTGQEVVPPEWDQTDFSCIPRFGPINQSVDCISETSPQPDTFTWRLERPNGTVSWDENNLDTITFIADEPGFYDVGLHVTLGESLDTWINKTDYISIQGTQGNMTPWQTAPNVSLQIDPVGTLAPWSIWNGTTVRGDLETTFGNWSVPYLDMVDGMAAGLQTLFENFTGLVNWAPLKILAMIQMVNGVLGSVIAAVSSSANVLLQIMAHSLNALPWQLQGLLCYRITLDFVYLLLRGET